MFYVTSILLGIGLAMDAFSVSLVNGLNEPNMRVSKAWGISATFGIFQTAMPLIGWVCVHTILSYFESFSIFIPYIALLLLTYIGIKMLVDGIKNTECNEKVAVGTIELLIQAVATSIDALSVGFTIASLGLMDALVSTIIIGLVTMAISYVGIIIGKRVGTKISNKANILGGIILILIGIKIFIS